MKRLKAVNLSKGISLMFALLLLSFTSNAQYCNSGFFSSGCAAFGDQINGFSTTGGTTNISNLNSGCSSGSYGYFSSQIYTGIPSGTVNFTIVNNPSYGEYYNIFVDWNQDGDFFDAGETVYANYLSSNQTVSGTFNIPTSATPGLTRLRVFANYGSYATSACQGSTWGEVEDYDFYIAGNCNAVASITTTLIGSMAVDFTWTPVANSFGYDYAVTTTPNAPQTGTTTTNTSATITGLTPSTLYYLHVRNKCSSYPSVWTTINFNTLPPCVIANPPGITVPYVDSNSATVAWQAVGTGIEYDYIVREDTVVPSSSATPTTITTNQINLTALESGKTYFFFLRVRCIGNDTSNWIMDSIYVPIPCHAPDVKINDLSTNRAVAYWDTPLTAKSYEIINSSSMISYPVSGIPLIHNSYLFSFLDDAKVYYLYSKSYCQDRDIKTESPWATIEYRTWGLDVDDVSFEAGLMNVYPNPVENQMTVNIRKGIGENSIINILDITGRVLNTLTVTDQKTTVDVSDLQPGTYMLQYVDGNRREQVKFTKL